MDEPDARFESVCDEFGFSADERRAFKLFLEITE